MISAPKLQKISMASILLLMLLTNTNIAAAQETSGQSESTVDTGDILSSMRRCVGDQISMNDCAQAHARAVMPMLESAASRVRALFDRDTDQSSFDKAQDAYTANVEAACSLDAALIYPGSMAGWSMNSCIVRRAARRIKALDDYYRCKSGQDSCVSGTTLTDADLGEIE